MSTSPTARQCVCKGIRTCLICENNGERNESINTPQGASQHKQQLTFNRQQQPTSTQTNGETWVYCSQCTDKAFPSDLDDHSLHHSSQSYLPLPGVLVVPDYLSESEQNELVQGIDRKQWVNSQSGRRKQDFGPKVNFKKKKVKLESFQGFPLYAQPIIQRLYSIPLLADFKPVEMCNLEYEPCQGSAIDPHYDDFWLWGERLVTINLLAKTHYTLSLPDSNTRVLIPLPARCLIVLYGDARHKWMHAIAREHILSRRIGIAIRELSAEFMDGACTPIGQQLLSKAQLIVNI